MKREKLIKSIKFTLYSFSAGAIELIVFLIMDNSTKLDFWVSYTVALTISVVWNYYFNREYIFSKEKPDMYEILEKAIFYVFFAPVTAILGQFFVEGKAYNSSIVIFIILVINFILEYVYDRYILYDEPVNLEDDNKLTT